MSIGKLTLTSFLTLDDVMFRIVSQRFGNADAFLLGRKTYQIFAAYSLIRGDLAEQVAELKRRYPREIQVHGSGDLAQTRITRDLVDEYHLWLYPVILGTGKRLFASGTVPAALTLAETTTTSTGVVVSINGRAGKPTYGSFELDQA
jgi:dihydrofolate reductase